MQRRKFSREFKLEAVKLVLERGVSAGQAARDLDVQLTAPLHDFINAYNYGRRLKTLPSLTP